MLELLIGFSVLAIAVMSIFLLFPSSDKAVMRAARTNQANEIARSILEETVDQEYATLVPGVSDGIRNELTLTRNGADIPTVYNYRVTIEQPDPALEIKTVKVRVYWQEGKAGLTHECILETSKGQFF